MSVISMESKRTASLSDVAPVPSDSTSGSGTSNGFRVAKGFAALGVVAAVGVVGFVLGSDQSATTAATPASGSTDGETQAVSAEAQALITLGAGINDETNLALTGDLTIEIIDRQLDIWEAAPGEYNDQFLTHDVMQAFKTLRDSFRAESSADRNLKENLRRESYRELAGVTSALAVEAWERIETQDYSGGIVADNDQVVVEVSSSQCWVIAQETNAADDWGANFNLGATDILSIRGTSVAAATCGCAVETEFWCAEYESCVQTTTVGRGYKGFVNAYNNLRERMWSALVAGNCQNKEIVLAGYSRGGAIVGVLGFALYTEGLIEASRIKMVNFGTPRVLSDADSDTVHGKFPQSRLVYKQDIVPSVPYSWMGFKHFGENSCMECNYSAGRDKPSWSWSTGDHTSYCVGYGDKVCQPE